MRNYVEWNKWKQKFETMRSPGKTLCVLQRNTHMMPSRCWPLFCPVRSQTTDDTNTTRRQSSSTKPLKVTENSVCVLQKNTHILPSCCWLLFCPCEVPNNWWREQNKKTKLKHEGLQAHEQLMSRTQQEDKAQAQSPSRWHKKVYVYSGGIHICCPVTDGCYFSPVRSQTTDDTNKTRKQTKARSPSSSQTTHAAKTTTRIT
jgi:hypothetical protein